MLDGMRNLRERLSEIEWSTEETDSTLPYLRAATAQLLVATGAGASLEHAAARPAASGRPGRPKKRSGAGRQSWSGWFPNASRSWTAS